MQKPFKSIFAGVFIAIAVEACSLFGSGLAPTTEKSRDYTEALDGCRAYSNTCVEMVACQHKEQAKRGYPLTGDCDAHDR